MSAPPLALLQLPDELLREIGRWYRRCRSVGVCACVWVVLKRRGAGLRRLRPEDLGRLSQCSLRVRWFASHGGVRAHRARVWGSEGS